MNARAVLHPVHSPRLPDVLDTVPGLDVVEPLDDAGVAAALERDRPILITFRWDDRFLTPRLRWVHAISAGYDQFPADRLAQQGVILTHSAGAHTPAVAEHAIALLLALSRGIGLAVRRAVDADWAPQVVGGDEIGGRTLGVLGLGSIGDAVAERARALGMTVVGTKRHPDGYEGPAHHVLPPDRTQEVFERSDAVVIALPNTSDTRGLVSTDALAALGDGWLVNVGRGSAVDQRALVDALRRGVLRGAGLDVFEEEPLPADSPLWTMANVILTPHSAWFSPRLEGRLVEVLRANLAAWDGAGAWRNRVV